MTELTLKKSYPSLLPAFSHIKQGNITTDFYALY